MKIYKIIARHTAESLQVRVNELINEGYLLAGGVQYGNENGQDHFIQSVVIDKGTMYSTTKEKKDEESTGKQNDGLQPENKKSGSKKRRSRAIKNG